MDRRLDPRTIVTPYAFSVHPDLLGMPLATPWQRLGAILVDLLVIAVISQIGLGPLAVASALLLVWMATRRRGRDVFGKLMRVAVGCLGLLVLAITVFVALFVQYGPELQEAIESAGGNVPEVAGDTSDLEEEGIREMGFMDVLQGFQGAAAIQRAETRQEAQALMEEFVGRAYAAGISRREIRDLLSGVLPDDAPWSGDTSEMIDLALASLETPSQEQVTGEPREAGAEQGDPVVLSPEAEDSIARLTAALQDASNDREDLERSLTRARTQLEAERDQGPLAWLWSLIDELGIGFGWGALYLTITHAWWRGTSIGKKLFRIRVVMIDKRPLNWWLSFERAGGYAAGFATGLLGFAQIFWDPNRQAIHDKVSETVVIQDGKEPIPGPWVEEGRAQWQRRRSGTGRSQHVHMWPCIVFLLAGITSSCGGGNGDTGAGYGPRPGSDPTESRVSDPRPPTGDPDADPLRISEMGYNRGSPEAPVKVLEISDFGCGYCRRFHQETFPSLAEVYVDEGLVEWKFIPFVLGKFPNGLQAAMAAECAGEQGGFFPMQGRLFAEQQAWRGSDTPYRFFSRLAEEEGLDVQRFDTCIASGWRENRLRANIRLAQQAGARGTPYFLVDGRPVPGVLPLEDFRQVLDVALIQRGREPPGR